MVRIDAFIFILGLFKK